MSMSRQKAPSYKSFHPSSASASFAMRHNKAKNTVPEVSLRKALWNRGVRYRLHVSRLPGKPDIVFPRERIVIFIDGDFWHGRNWVELEKKLLHRANAEYWIAKILYNRTRDQEQREGLEKQGWTVIRFWETDITKNIEEAVETVIMALKCKSQAQQ